MFSEQWKQKKQDFIKKVLLHETSENDSFFKVDDSENQNKTYAAGTPWTTLIKDSSQVNSRVFVRENYHNHDIFSTDDDLGNAILTCAVKKAAYNLNMLTEKELFEIYEAIKNHFSDSNFNGKDLITIVKLLRDLDHEELFN